MEDNVHIVGIGGLPRSGKDTLAEMFIDAGYYGVSLGDIVRDISRERHKDKPDPISVGNMTETSNWLRTERGADFAIKEALARYHVAQNTEGKYLGLVVFSVRAPVEVDFIRSHGGELIWLEADDAIRHERAMKHRRAGEATITLDEFKKQEDLQWQPQPGLPKEVQMNTQYVKEKATIVINNGRLDIDEFKKHAEDVITSVLSKQS